MKKIIAIIAAFFLAVSPLAFASGYDPGGNGTDSRIGTLTNGKWCTSNGTTLACTTTAPVTSEADPTVDTSLEIQAIIGASVYAAYGSSGITIKEDGKICIVNGTDVECNIVAETALVGATQILTGGTPTADSDLGETYNAAKAIDGDAATRWNSTDSAFPHWWKYDLGVGNTDTVSDASIKSFGDGDGIGFKDFKIQGSNNDSTWTDIYTGQQANNQNVQTYTFTESAAFRYFRIYVTSTWRPDGYCHLAELILYSPAPTALNYTVPNAVTATGTTCTISAISKGQITAASCV